MKKAISIFLCLNVLSLNFAFAQVFKDNLAEQLDKNLTIKKIKYQPIEDEFVLKTLKPDLKIEKTTKIYYKDDFASETLNPNLKIEKKKQSLIVDEAVLKIDKTKLNNKIEKVATFEINDGKIKIAPKNYYTTKNKLAEGDFIDFILVENVKIKNTTYKKGTLIKARIETLSQNGAYGVPADLVVGNFTLPDKKVLNGTIEKQGANRSLWVYPLGYTLTCFFFIGLPIFAIRGGHVQLKPEKVYEIDI